jgi:tetraacyldisaccharide 4'-kinase
VPWSQVAGSRCLAFAGIARPDDFFLELRGKGCDLLHALPLADHQEYDPDLLKRISKASQNVDFILTTEKDAVKLKGIGFPKPCLTVPLELEFEQFEIIEKLLDNLLQSYAK